MTGWRIERHPRFLTDLTGKSRAALVPFAYTSPDIVGFGDAGVWTALGNGDGTFQNPNFVLADFGYEAGGWRVEKHPRFLADIRGIGYSDIVGFGDAGVYTALTKGDGTFRSPNLVVTNFGYEAGMWRVEKHPRFVVDLRASGPPGISNPGADIVGFGDAGVWTALSNVDGTFQNPNFVLAHFGYAAP